LIHQSNSRFKNFKYKKMIKELSKEMIDDILSEFPQL